MDFKTIFQNFKNMFSFKPRTLIVRYDTNDVKIDLLKKNEMGVTSQTFYKLMSPEFRLDNNRHSSGLKITTLIDKKTGGPVRAYVARIESDEPNSERYCIMVEAANGDNQIGDKYYKTVGTTYFYIDKKEKMIMPKFELILKEGIMYEKISSFMNASGNSEYAGIGTRLHQIRIERMLQSGMGNSCIVAKGNSFPFHYSMGYRLSPSVLPIRSCFNVLKEISDWNNKTINENTKYLFAKQQDNEYVIDRSATMEHFLYEYYKNGGTELQDIMPNMFLNETSLSNWVKMIKQQPILY